MEDHEMTVDLVRIEAVHRRIAKLLDEELPPPLEA